MRTPGRARRTAGCASDGSEARVLARPPDQQPEFCRAQVVLTSSALMLVMRKASATGMSVTGAAMLQIARLDRVRINPGAHKLRGR